MTLMCGGRGPCCHVGYPHRHCEHCDVVIAVMVQPHTHGWYSWSQPYYGTLQSQLANAIQYGSQQHVLQALQSAEDHEHS
jgi:hypothetical protein